MRLKFLLSSCAALFFVGIGLTACERDPARSFVKAQALAEKGDRTGAIVELKGAIQDAPANGPLRLLLGRLYNEKFDGASAEKELIKARKLGVVDDGHLSAELARALRRQGKFKELLSQVAAVSTFQREPLASVYALRGRAQHALHLDEDSKVSFAQAVKLSTNNPDVAILDAQIKAGEKDTSGALNTINSLLAQRPGLYDGWAYKAELLKFLGREDEAYAAFSEILKINPVDFRALLVRPTYLIGKGRLDDAQIDVDLFVRYYKGHPLAYIQQGVLRIAKGDYRGALESAELALKSVPNFGTANALAGAADFGMKAYVVAEQYLSKGLLANPKDLMTRRLLASTLLELGQPTRALEVITPAQTENAKDPRNFIIAGDAYLRLGALDKASAQFSRAAALDPNDATPKIKEALVEMGSGSEDVGLNQLESALAQYRTPSRADEMLILAYLQRKEVERAVQALDRLEKVNPENAILSNLRGVVLMAQGKQPEATKVFEATLAKHPTFLPAADNLAELDLLANKLDAAREWYVKVLSADPKNLQAMLAIASIEEKRGHEKEEREILEQAAMAAPGAFVPRRELVPIYLRSGAKDRAMTVMDEALAAEPDNPAVIVLAAQTQFATGNTNRAIETVRRLLHSAPTSGPAHLLLAQFQGAVGQVSEAEQTLRASLAINPHQPETQSALVSLLVAQKKFDDAQSYVIQVQTNQSNSPIGFILEGEIEESREKFADAVRSYNEALTRQPAGEIAVKIYGAEVRGGNTEEAFTHLNRWLDAHPNDPVARATVADVLLHNGDYKAAATQYERVLKIPQVPSLVRNGLAWAYYKMKDRRALATAQSAYAASPNSALISDTVGWILVEQGDTALGLPYLHRAILLEPDNPEIGFHLATALAKSGDRDAARAQLTKILGSGKPFGGIKDAQALLTSLK